MGTGAELAGLDATAQAELVRRHKVSALESIDAAIANIERLDGHLNAVIHRRFERARARQEYRARADTAPPGDRVTSQGLARALLAEGLSLCAIARRLNAHPMAVRRALAGS